MSVSRINLAPDGPNFSRLAWGAWRLADAPISAKEIHALVCAAFELGITTIDHADIYGGYTCEKLFGDALAADPALRRNLQLVTKCGIKLVSPNRPAHRLKQYDTSRAHIVASLENSLVQLRVEHVDLLLIHRPDPLLDADEVARAFVELKQAGKVRHFGVSNFTPAQYDLLAARLPFPLVTNQVQISVMHLDALLDGTLDQCQRLRIAPMAWSPLHGGRLLTEDSPRAKTVRETLTAIAEEHRVALDLYGERISMRETLTAIAKEHSSTLEQIALAWVLMLPAKPQILLGTVNPGRLRAVAGAERVPLTREQWFRIWTAAQGREVA